MFFKGFRSEFPGLKYIHKNNGQNLIFVVFFNSQLLDMAMFEHLFQRAANLYGQSGHRLDKISVVFALHCDRKPSHNGVVNYLPLQLLVRQALLITRKCLSFQKLS